MSRRKLREKLFSLLFRVEFNDYEEMKVQKELFLEEESELTEEEAADINSKLDAILEKKDELDDLLRDKMTGWNLDRIGKVELTILRLALYEMKYDDLVPESVAINEAVELTKIYGQESSAAFINGVLAKLTKDKEDNTDEVKTDEDVIGTSKDTEGKPLNSTEEIVSAKGSILKSSNAGAQILVKKPEERRRPRRPRK